MSNQFTGAIGIDVGTSYCRAAVWLNDEVRYIPNEQENNSITTPSCLSFSTMGVLVGDSARKMATTLPQNTVFDFKRFVGRKYSDNIVQRELGKLPYKVVSREKNKPFVDIPICRGEYLQISPERLYGLLAKKMKEIAEKFLNQAVTNAVITVPANFSHIQRHVVMTACKDVAGLNVLRMISEPSATAMAYDLEHNVSEEKNVLVFDFGGGSTNVSIVTVQEGICEVKATAGDPRLGGEDVTNHLFMHMIKQYSQKFNIKEISEDTAELVVLREACEQAKLTLSQDVKASVNVKIGDNSFTSEISREEFEALNQDVFAKCLMLVGQVLEDSALGKDQIHDILVVGGSSHIPRVQELLAKLFEGKTLNLSMLNKQPVVTGAAIQAAILTNSGSQKLTDSLLLDCTPLSLGLVANGKMHKLIKRNTTFPVTRTISLTTTHDDQTDALIEVYEGEDEDIKNDSLLQRIILNNIPKSPAGSQSIEVKLDIDANCILHVYTNSHTENLKTTVMEYQTTERLQSKHVPGYSKEHLENMRVAVQSAKHEVR